MAHWFKKLFGEAGDKTAIPETDGTGNVNYNDGFTLYYALPYGTDPLAKTIDRETINQAFYDITGALQQYQTHGFPDYIDATANGGTAYAYGIGAVARWTDNKNYRNTVAGNTNAPNVSGWVLYNNPADAINSATAKTTPVDADQFGIADSAASNVLKKTTWGNIVTALTSLFAPVDSPDFTTSATLDGTSLERYFKVTDVSASGTAIDFTGIPSWAKKIKIVMSGISTNSTAPLLIQIGDSGGVENTGYKSTASTLDGGASVASYTGGFGIKSSGAALDISGSIDLINIGSNNWVLSGVLSATTTSVSFLTSGNKTLSDTLDRVRITTGSGTDTFDAGNVTIIYEG